VSTSNGRWRAGRWRTATRWLPAIGWMSVIFALSSISGLRVSEEVAVDRPIRTLAHLASYAFLAGLLLFAMSGLERPRPRHLAAAFAIAVLYGVSDELHQTFVPERSGRIEDVAIDAFGVTIGLAIAWVILARRAVTHAGSSGPPAGVDGGSDDQWQ